LANGQSLIKYVGQGTNANAGIPNIDANQEATLSVASGEIDGIYIGYVDGDPWNPYRRTRSDKPDTTPVQEPPGIAKFCRIRCLSELILQHVERIENPRLHLPPTLTSTGLAPFPQQTNAQSTNVNGDSLPSSNQSARYGI
jgi:hypothetical protein